MNEYKEAYQVYLGKLPDADRERLALDVKKPSKSSTAKNSTSSSQVGAHSIVMVTGHHESFWNFRKG